MSSYLTIKLKRKDVDGYEFIRFDISDGLESVLIVGESEKHAFTAPWSDDDDECILWEYESANHYDMMEEDEKIQEALLNSLTSD